MYDMGSFPYVVKTDKGGVVLEHYRVPDTVARAINRMESLAGYTPSIYKDPNGMSFLMWVMGTRQSLMHPQIKHGDYVEYLRRKNETKITRL